MQGASPSIADSDALGVLSIREVPPHLSPSPNEKLQEYEIELRHAEGSKAG